MGAPLSEFLASGPTYLTPNLRRRPIWLLGASGSGKTNLLMVVLHVVLEEVAAGQRSLVVFDFRGDLLDRVILAMVALGRPAGKRAGTRGRLSSAVCLHT